MNAKNLEKSMKEEELVTVVMYHYVRPIKDSKFPRIKGLELELFKLQLDYLKKNFNMLKFFFR